MAAPKWVYIALLVSLISLEVCSAKRMPLSIKTEDNDEQPGNPSANAYKVPIPKDTEADEPAHKKRPITGGFSHKTSTVRKDETRASPSHGGSYDDDDDDALHHKKRPNAGRVSQKTRTVRKDETGARRSYGGSYDDVVHDSCGSNGGFWGGTTEQAGYGPVGGFDDDCGNCYYPHPNPCSPGFGGSPGFGSPKPCSPGFGGSPGFGSPGYGVGSPGLGSGLPGIGTSRGSIPDDGGGRAGLFHDFVINELVTAIKELSNVIKGNVSSIAEILSDNGKP